MESRSDANLINPTRQESLLLWMRRNGHSFRGYGRDIGLSGVQVANLCGQDTMPTQRHAQLVALGVPVDLLPEPLDVKPGPKPRVVSVHEEFRDAYRA